MKYTEISIEQFHIMKNSYGRLCLAHGGILLGKFGNIEIFESAIMNNFHPFYDKKGNIMGIKRKEKE